MGRWRIINGALVVIALLLLFEIVRTWGRSLPPVEIVARPAGDAPATGKRGEGKGKRGDKSQARAAEQTPAAMVTAIVDRDLFDPSRTRPADAPQSVAAPVATPPPNVTLVGVRAWGKDREVFVNDQNQQRRLRIGDQIAGYTVKRIDPTEVLITSPSGDPITMTLNIEKGKAGAPGAPKPAAVAKPPTPGQPGTPPGAASPAAGMTGSSPAAGIQPPKPPPVPVQPGAPGTPGVPGQAPQPGVPQPGQRPPGSQLPTEVRERLEKLKQEREAARMNRNKR